MLTPSTKYYINENWSHNDFSGYDFTGYTFINVNFNHTNLTDTIFDSSLCKECTFNSANLTRSSLIGADLRNSDFDYANLSGANFYCSQLENTVLTHVITSDDTRYFHQKCPETGPFIGFKNCYGERIVQLLIPADAMRSSATNDTCRCSKAKVLSIKSPNLQISYNEASSYVDDSFIYRVGDYVKASNFNTNRWVDSTTGIHFFMTRSEAISYM